MKIITSGHEYELDSFEDGAPQSIKFINKKPKYTQEELGNIYGAAVVEARKHGGFPSDHEHAGYEARAAVEGQLSTVHDGTTNEEVLAMLIDRMNYLQKLCPCRENAIVITKLEESLMWLNKRTAGRKARNVEGKHIA